MFLTDDPTAVSVMPTPGAAGTPGYFTDGNAGTGVPPTILRADFMNMVASELMNVVTGAGLTPSKTTFNQVYSAIQALAAKNSIVGTMRNARMNVGTASDSATFTADEIVVESALGGTAYKLSGFNKTITLGSSGSTGAGYMDTGSPPLAGYVALYAIYNPTTGTAAILAQDTTSIVAPEVYGGSNMPSGYTASALISVWGCVGRQFVVGSQRDRQIAFPNVQAASINQSGTSTPISGSASISGIVPKNAYSLFGHLLWGTLGGLTTYGFDFTGINMVKMEGYATYEASPFSDLILATPQTVAYHAGVGSSPFNFSLYLGGYRF